MAERKKLRFGAFFSVPGCHPMGWRHRDAVPECDLDFRWLAHMARTAERGKLDAMFFQDSAAVVGSGALYGGQPFNVRNGRQAHIEPVSVIAALAAVTSQIEDEAQSFGFDEHLDHVRRHESARPWRRRRSATRSCRRRCRTTWPCNPCRTSAAGWI